MPPIQDRTWRLAVEQTLHQGCSIQSHRLQKLDSEYTSQFTQSITQPYHGHGFQNCDTTFTGYDPIAIADSFQIFKIACDENCFSERAEMWFF